MKAFKTIAYLALVLACLSSRELSGQDPAVYIPFDSCNLNEKSGLLKSQSVGALVCECGAVGSALRWNGGFHFADWEGSVLDNLFAGDFTVSFYFRPDDITGTIDILSKRENCGIDSLFAIRYLSDEKTIVAELAQRVDQGGTLQGVLPSNSCWYHIVFTRSGRRLALFVNGEEKDSKTNNYIIDLRNKAKLALANSPCLGVTDRRFAGSLDELRFYKRALSRDEIRGLHVRPEHIANRDTVIFKGGSVQVRVNTACAAQAQWNPVRGVSDPSKRNSLISPDSTTTYVLRSDFGSCVVRDTFKIIVINEADLDCDKVNLPNAFTPNNDGLNDVFRINNPYVIEDLHQFEIYDRWGEKVFSTSDSQGAWDGNFRSKPLNPGIFIYHLKYFCRGELRHKTGSLTLIR